MFSVAERRARQLLHLFGGSGSPMAVDRDQLEARLGEMLRTGELALSAERRAVLGTKLEELRKFRRTPYADVRIPAGRAAHGCLFAQLPPGIRFEPGQLVIEHAGIEDLLSKLFLLSQAATNDLQAVVEEIQKPPTRDDLLAQRDQLMLRAFRIDKLLANEKFATHTWVSRTYGTKQQSPDLCWLP